MNTDLSIINHIREVLAGDAQKHAFYFVTYLQEQGMQLIRGKGYWEDKHYWIIKHQGEHVCFILVNGFGLFAHKDEPEGWYIWSDDSGKVDWFADSQPDEDLKEIAWANVDFCGHCGGRCDGGFRKTIFGKEFDHVCNTTFRFDNPNADAVGCAVKLIELRKQTIKK